MRSTRCAAFLGLAALAGCCKAKLQSVPPQIQLLDSSGASLTTLTFPATAFDGTSSETFLVKSLSTTPLIVSSLQITGPAQSFYTFTVPDGGALPLNLLQDETQGVVVTFAPVATPPVPQGLIPEDATFTVASNDPANGQVAIPISGKAAAPSINVCWLRASGTNDTCLVQGAVAVQFGNVPLGRGNSSPPAVISISSATAPGDGGVPAKVTSVSVDAAGAAAGFALVNPIAATPAVLDGGTSLTFYVALFPNALGTAAGNLVIESDDPHFPPGSPPQVSLSATVTPRTPPVACEGAIGDAPAVGTAGSPIPADGGVLEASWVPAPLDTVTVTGLVDAGCSADAVDPQASLQFSFSLEDGGVPPGSMAQLQAVAGKPAEATLQLDLAGSYQVNELVTDLVNLQSLPASLSFTAQPRDDIAAQLTWTASASPTMQLDLHLVRVQVPGTDPSGLLATTNDCWWDNCLAPNATLPRLAWGPGSPAGFGDPAVGTEFGQPTAPFQAGAEAYTTLSGPEAGAQYDLYVWYFHVGSGAGSVCASDGDCTQAGYPKCSNNKCVPSGDAKLLVFVGGQEITGGGLTQTLGKPCDLWHAGTIAWTSGGQQPGGGSLPDVYTFAPDTAVTSDTVIGCAP